MSNESSTIHKHLFFLNLIIKNFLMFFILEWIYKLLSL